MKKLIKTYLPYAICLVFFIAYGTLSVVKHDHFLSGYDLSVSDQGVWLMGHFLNPISTPHAYAFTSLFADHVEIIYALLSPIYWLTNDPRVLIVLQALAISLSGIPVYLFARAKKLKFVVSIALLISFLMFYGIQNAIWADVHSLVFAASFLPWFLYFLDRGRTKLTLLFFLLLIFCKEDIAMFTFLISGIMYLTKRKKLALVLMISSVVYLGIIFGIYYPHFTPNGYRFQNEGGLLSNLDLTNMYNTQGKRDVLLYSSLWFGLLPFLAPLYLLPAVGDVAHYFVLGSNYVTSAQGMFLHYRVTLAILLIWPTILVIARYKRLNNVFVALYVLFMAFLLQYHLHLPLSYLAKQWFWQKSASVGNINKMIGELPKDAAVVTQINISPHINHRKEILTMWPEARTFTGNSPCDKPTCSWFRWPGDPEYLLVDTSSDWDARHFLTDRETFVQGVANLEKAGIIKKDKQEGNAVLYKVLEKPSIQLKK